MLRALLVLLCKPSSVELTGRVNLSISLPFLRHPSKMDAVEYSIGVNNRFMLLADDEEAENSVVESAKSTKEKEKKKPKDARPVKDSKAQQSKKEKEAVNEETRRDVRDNKKGVRLPKDGVKRENEKNTKLTNGPNREDRENIPPSRGGKGGFNRRRENEGQPDSDSPAKPDDKERAGGMGFGRGRAGRGGGRGRGGFDRGRGRKREFERRSGSDRSSVKPQEKREGGGSYNWGSATDTQEAVIEQEKRSADWAESSPEADENRQKEGQYEEAEDAEDEKEEPKEMTLEEWKEIQGKFRAKINYEVRKPGEGEKKGQWKNTHVLQQKSDEEDQTQFTYEERIKTSNKVKQKVTGIHFDFVNHESKNMEPRRGRGGRGGRGRGGGRGSSRGRGRGGAGFGSTTRESGNTEFEINEEEFPTL